MFAKLLPAMLALSAAAAGAPVHADVIEKIEGATKKEREIRWLWKYTGTMIRACTAGDCQKPEVQAVLKQLSAQWPAVPQPSASAWGQRLHFVAEAANPDLFRTAKNETHRVAITELKEGAPIYINTDRMGSLSSLQWVGILMHEAVHGLGIDDDERRLPDTVGAAVASFAQANLIESTLEEFGHSDVGTLAFSDPSLAQPARTLISVLNMSMDNDLGPNPRVPICKPGETFVGQTVGAPLWRVVYLRGDKGLVKIRGSARVNNVCRAAGAGAGGATSTAQTSFVTVFDLHFAHTFDPQSAWWEQPSTIDPGTIAGGNTDGNDVAMDVYRTFAIESITHSKKVYNPGETWTTRIVVNSTDGFKPSVCVAAFAGSKWFFNRMMSFGMFENFQSCMLTALGGNRYQVDASYPLAKEIQPDVFALSFIYFGNGDQNPSFDHFALPGKPVFMQVVNPAAAVPLQIWDWQTENLPPRNTIGGRAGFQRSYQVKRNEAFWIEFEVKGHQAIQRLFMDFDYITGVGAAAVITPLNVEVKSDVPMFLKTEITPTADGQRVRIQMRIPDQVAMSPALGFHLRRLSVQTGDFSWSEWESPGYGAGWFLTDQVPP